MCSFDSMKIVVLRERLETHGKRPSRVIKLVSTSQTFTSSMIQSRRRKFTWVWNRHRWGEGNLMAKLHRSSYVSLDWVMVLSYLPFDPKLYKIHIEIKFEYIYRKINEFVTCITFCFQQYVTSSYMNCIFSVVLEAYGWMWHLMRNQLSTLWNIKLIAYCSIAKLNLNYFCPFLNGVIDSCQTVPDRP